MSDRPPTRETQQRRIVYETIKGTRSHPTADWIFDHVRTKMPKIFSMFTACSMASLALPGMSGFVAELMVFVGFANSDAYSFNFKLIMILLMAVGVILTPIYLLSMLREIFFGPENKELIEEQALIDAEPREVFIIACLLVPIIGFGLYPKLITQVYDAKTMQISETLRTELFAIADHQPPLPIGNIPPAKAPAIGR